MKCLFIVIISLFFLSCNLTDYKKDSFLKQWIYNNQDRLNSDIDDVIKNYLIKEKQDSNWSTVGIITTMYAPNSLGTLAKIAGDSSECIVVDLTFYRDKTRKREIMIAAQDSSCLDKLNTIKLGSDSIGNLVYGKKAKPLYTKEGDPLQ